MKFSNNMRSAIAIFFMFFTLITGAQNATILDEEGIPLEGALVYNTDKSKNASSDVNGEVNLSEFGLKERLHFYHLGFIERVTTRERLLNHNNVIYLKIAHQALDEVILSASKTGENRTRVAEKVAIISSDDIENIAAPTSADLLTNVPGLRVQKSQGGGGSPVIRGFEANRVLLVVDGVRMNNAIYRSGHLQNAITISPNALERTEILFGPSSVIYGSDALGGVVHFYTKQPKINDENLFSGSYSSQYSQANDEYTNSVDFELSFKNWASYTSVSYADFGDIRMGRNRLHGFDDWGLVEAYSDNTENYYNANPIANPLPYEQKGTAYNQLDILQKFGIKLDEKTKLSLNFQYSESSNIPRFDRLAEYRSGELRFARWDYGPQRRFLISPQLQFNPQKKWLKKGVITAAFQNIEESRIERNFGSLTRESQFEEVNVYSLNADFFADLREKRNLSYGLEFTHNDVASIAFSEDLELNGSTIVGLTNKQDIPTRYPSDGSTYSTAAIYTNYRQDVSENSTFNSGVRYTFTNLRAAWLEEALVDSNLSSVRSVNNSFTATLGYTLRPTNLWQLNAVLSSGFRSPNIDDIGKIREQSGTLTIPNPSLDPEYAYNGEIGITRFISNKQNMFSINAYYTWLRNYIGRETYVIAGDTSTSDPSTIMYNGEEVETLANTNLGNAYILGGTFDMNTQLLRNLRFRGNLTYTLGKTFVENQALPSILPFFGHTALLFNSNNFESQVVFRFAGHKNPEDYSPGGEDGLEETPEINANATDDVDRYFGAPAWQTADIKAGYQITDSTKIQLALNNIFDVHYREFASGISAVGRNFRVLLNIKF